MLVYFSLQAAILVDVLAKNNKTLFLEGITFSCEYTDDIDLSIIHKKDLLTYPTTNNNIILGIDISLPCSIHDLASLIKEKLFSSSQYQIRNLIFKPTAYSIFSDNNELLLKLTEKEANLIEYLLKKGKRGATEIELLSNIWHYSSQSSTSTVETHVYRLRQKLETIDFKDLIIYVNKSYFINLAFHE